MITASGRLVCYADYIHLTFIEINPAPNITDKNQDNSIGKKYKTTANQTDKHSIQSNGFNL